MANDGAIVATPCMRIPGRPTAPACRSVLNPPVWGRDPTSPLALSLLGVIFEFGTGQAVDLKPVLADPTSACRTRQGRPGPRGVTGQMSVTTPSSTTWKTSCRLTVVGP
jgi:hypothetical protein